jgi:hypothetical protein
MLPRVIRLQGSGKSTFYRTHYAATHVLVIKDRFRNNHRPQRRQTQRIEQALKAARSSSTPAISATTGASPPTGPHRLTTWSSPA